MKPNNLLMLAFALSTALVAAGCDRDRDETPAATTAAPAATAPAPAPVAAPPAATPAPATPVDSGLSFADMDKNHDGSITKDELADTEMLYQHFAEADTNGDGKLSQAEVDKHRADMAAAPAQ